jgi:SAM-dependent methyltransferase
MSTDHDWIRWGEQDPYFAVITQPRFRAGVLTEEARREFFDSGHGHVEHVLARCRRVAGEGYVPARALDFGCGVGRVTLPLAQRAATVVGIDVSPAMLAEARRNAEARGLANVEWILSDDALSKVQGGFDLVHSCITFQHIDVPRGRALFARLLEVLAPGGVGAVHITYAKRQHAQSWGQPPAQPPLAGEPAAPSPSGRHAAPAPAAPLEPPGDPGMQMNAYPLGEIAWLMQQAGVRAFEAEFTDHGGELGVFLYFRPG